MKDRWDNSDYKKLVRIKEKQLKWLMKYKKQRTAAGFLDEIIKEYKKVIHN